MVTNSGARAVMVQPVAEATAQVNAHLQLMAAHAREMRS
jgi:hypothetical protein